MLDIPKFYRREAYLLLMAGHVLALTRHFRGMTQRDAVADFVNSYGLGDELNEESLLVELNRLTKEYKTACQNKN